MGVVRVSALGVRLGGHVRILLRELVKQFVHVFKLGQGQLGSSMTFSQLGSL